MSLQQIMDATPIVSWNYVGAETYIGSSHKYTYSYFSGRSGKYFLFWPKPLYEEPKTFVANSAKEIIDKINELEGIK